MELERELTRDRDCQSWSFDPNAEYRELFGGLPDAHFRPWLIADTTQLRDGLQHVCSNRQIQGVKNKFTTDLGILILNDTTRKRSY